MKKNAYLILEIGDHQFQDCKEIFANSPVIAAVGPIADLEQIDIIAERLAA